MFYISLSSSIQCIMTALFFRNMSLAHEQCVFRVKHVLRAFPLISVAFCVNFLVLCGTLISGVSMPKLLTVFMFTQYCT